MGEKKLLLLWLLTTMLRGRRAQQMGAVAVRWSGPSEHAVKLCGRHFIRAVIFTCGASRWKRLALQQQQGVAQPPLPGSARPDFLQSDKGLEDIKLQSELDPKLEQLRSIRQAAGQQSLKDLFNVYEDYEYVPTSDNFSEYIRQLEDASHKSTGETGLAMSSSNFPWAKYPRRKRELSRKVAEICCKLGCTKTEISTIC